MEVKCPCEKCGSNIEFEAEQAGQDATCPHCGQVTYLKVPLPTPPIMPKVAPITPRAERALSRKPYSATFMHLASGLGFLVGCGHFLKGCADDSEAKSAIQQAPAYTEFCAGALLVGISFLIHGLAKIEEAIRDK